LAKRSYFNALHTRPGSLPILCVRDFVENGHMNDDLTSLKAALARIDDWFATYRPRFHDGLHAGASADELVGLPIPIQTLLAWHNGQSGDFVGCFESNWFLMSAAEIRATELDHVGWVPFFDDDAGAYLCVDTTASPSAIRLYSLDEVHDTFIAASLTVFMSRFADALEQGRYEEDPERGTFSRG